MKPGIHLPNNVKQLKEDETFCFSCHPGVPCFCDCCQQLELALTPYDVLRLKEVLGLTGTQFLDQYAVIEYGEGDIFPRVYLAMKNDSRESCPFVSSNGCTVYEGRPSACRTYPLGRGAWLDQKGKSHASHVVIYENHCLGFAEAPKQNIAGWVHDQGLAPYNEANDQLMRLLQHKNIAAGFRPSASQCDLYIQTLYHLEPFKKTTADAIGLVMSDTALLPYAINWLIDELFPEEKN
ncbi:MAG: YkgJ family cysteine cluster protein [Desulfobulbaceae bacterium]|uniref:YkgJ family cysteine cluster protein n=1 Tax=Candidatus Desulfobia pelagia TaxID=2841692 RepID=A0A8J6TBZ0_9BACT|nr:YkgJ family cysteine cluster protein [Candidatus Desulfobia pelagia]